MIDLMCWLIHDGVSVVLQAGTGRPYVTGRNHAAGETMLHVHPSPDGYVIAALDAGRIAVVTSLRPVELENAWRWLPLISDVDYGSVAVPA